MSFFYFFEFRILSAFFWRFGRFQGDFWISNGQVDMPCGVSTNIRIHRKTHFFS